MQSLIPTTAYLVRAIHEWCIDNGLTPHLLVKVDARTRVPMAYVKEGEIVLNVNYTAVKELVIDNEGVSFSARFNGVAQSLYVPIGRVAGIFARENGQGMFFDVLEESAPAPEGIEGMQSIQQASDSEKSDKPKRSHLKVIK